MGLFVCLGETASAHPLFALHGISALGKSAVPDCSPHGLLLRAAALESTDMTFALALYKHIALNHPNTPAGKEATETFLTLRAAHPDLNPDRYIFKVVQ